MTFDNFCYCFYIYSHNLIFIVHMHLSHKNIDSGLCAHPIPLLGVGVARTQLVCYPRWLSKVNNPPPSTPSHQHQQPKQKWHHGGLLFCFCLFWRTLRPPRLRSKSPAANPASSNSARTWAHLLPTANCSLDTKTTFCRQPSSATHVSGGADSLNW